MKAWVLAEAKTGYIFNWSIYTGREDVSSGPLAQHMELNLVQQLHHQGHHLYFDNFYASPGTYFFVNCYIAILLVDVLNKLIKTFT